MSKSIKRLNSINKKAIIIYVLLVIFFACGKKGPLKPPPDISLQEEKKEVIRTAILPPKKFTYEIQENKGAVLLIYEADGCNSFKIYRYIKGKKKTSTPYGVTDKKVFLDETPLLNTPMIYEVSCVVNGNESDEVAKVEVIFK